MASGKNAGLYVDSVKARLCVERLGMTCLCASISRRHREMFEMFWCRWPIVRPLPSTAMPQTTIQKWRVRRCVRYAIDLLGRCFKSGVVNSDILMHLGLPLHEDDEKSFGHTKLKVGISADTTFEWIWSQNRLRSSDVRSGLVALRHEVSKDVQFIELFMVESTRFFFEWSRKLIERVGQSWPELNTFQVNVYSSFTDFVFHILATKTSRHPDLWNLAPKRGTTSEPHACVPHTKNQILPSCKICRSWDQGDWIAKIGSIWKNHEGDVKSESASLGNLS